MVFTLYPACFWTVAVQSIAPESLQGTRTSRWMVENLLHPTPVLLCPPSAFALVRFLRSSPWRSWSTTRCSECNVLNCILVQELVSASSAGQASCCAWQLWYSWWEVWDLFSSPYPVQVDIWKDCVGARVASCALYSTAFSAVSLVISRSLVQNCSMCCNVKTCVSRL